MLLVFSHYLGRHQGILSVHSTSHYAVQRVVVFGRDRIVLVIVASSAGYGQPQEATSRGIDSVKTLVSACLRRISSSVVPQTQAEKAGSRYELISPFPRPKIGSNLSLDEEIVWHVVVERLDDPIPVAP